MSNTRVANQARAPVNRPNAFDPRAPNLVQPFKRLVEEGFIKELVVTFAPTGITVVGKPDERMIAVRDSGLEKGKEYPVGVLSAVADRGELIPLRRRQANKKSAGQPLPKKTLCDRDFDAPDSEFAARCIAVAEACGGTTLVGRVRSEEAFNGKVTTTFQEWWKSAQYDERALALMQKKQRDEITDEKLKRLSKLQCPFRGPAEFVVAQEQASSPPKVGKVSSPGSGAGAPVQAARPGSKSPVKN